jgi:adenylate kinase
MHGVIVMLGAPLAGKGTQANLLSKALGIPALSSGDLFRSEVASGSELGQKMKSFMDKGLLIPNELTTELLETTLKKEMYQKGLIMDGYPRAISHLEILEGILLRLDRELQYFVYIDVPKDVLASRVASRLTCSKCSLPYSSKDGNLTTCTACGGDLIHRKDDDMSVFERRYGVFAEETIPLINYIKSAHPSRLLTFQPSAEENVDPNILNTQIRTKLNALADHIDSFSWIERRWEEFSAEAQKMRKTPDFSAFSQDLLHFRDKALHENRFRKTGTALRRFVYLQTKNVHKWREHSQIFDSLYGIEVLRLPPNLPEEVLQQLLLHRDKSLIPIAVIRETSNLFKPGSTILSSLRHGVSAVNRSHLRALSWNVKEKRYDVREYVHETVGTIDLTRRDTSLFGSRANHDHDSKEGKPSQGHLSASTLISSDPSVFSWDDIFVAPQLPYTFHELRQMGFKHSARDQVISDFIRDTIYYKDRLSLKFSNLSTARVVDFGVKVSDLVDGNEYYNNEWAVKFGYRRLIEHTLKMGAFWRSAENRRQNTYWCPGLNGGIPVVSKKDDKIHEDVFRAHDFGHYIVPDLIFTGTDSVVHRRAYVAYRMISEATTMTMADMLFVHALKTSGVEYDFSKRRIYPLFCALGLSFDDPSSFIVTLKQVVHANYVYCLQGDDGEYKKLLKKAGNLDPVTGTAPCLEAFKEKYMPFFVEDFRWTEHNYDNMVQRSEDLRRWWSATAPLQRFPHIPMVTVDDFLNSLSHGTPNFHDLDDKAFVDAVFEHVFENTISPVFQAPAPSVPESHLLFRAFNRWMTGQLAICSKFAPVFPQSMEIQTQIVSALVDAHNDLDHFSLEKVNAIRATFESYLQELVNRCLISKDDQRTFAEVYPLFDPYYVSYDKATSEYEDLKSVSQRTFSLSTHRAKQFDRIRRHIGHDLTAREQKCVAWMTDMIEMGGGQVSDGLFVTQPGVLLLTTFEGSSWKAFPHDQGMVSFLIAGVAIETSLELCAHKEARVARLTSSKTNAMTAPLFRVQGSMVSSPSNAVNSTAAQRMYLSQAVAMRNASLAMREQNSPMELKNMLLPACKATALCYSMKIADFHKLFIGRIPEPGNENEVRYVTAKMADILHAQFPEHIHPSAHYLGGSNKDKLATPSQVKAPTLPSNGKPGLWYHSVLTPDASRLFKRLNIADYGTNSAAGWAEFRSRLTYLVFPNAPVDPWSYLHDMVYEKGHTSVLDGYHLVIDAVQITPTLRPFAIPGSDRFIIITLKEFFAESHRANSDPIWNELFQLVKPFCPFLFDKQ